MLFLSFSNTSFKIFTVSILSALLCACSGYEVTLNERTVYTPPPLFTHFTTEDKNLQACIEQTIRDQNVREAEELKQLICTSAGINSIIGIHIFSQLQQLNLTDNNVQSLDPLTNLVHLNAISLKNNRLIHIDPLSMQTELSFLDLSGNKELKCQRVEKTLKALARRVDVTLPAQCQ